MAEAKKVNSLTVLTPSVFFSLGPPRIAAIRSTAPLDMVGRGGPAGAGGGGGPGGGGGGGPPLSSAFSEEYYCLCDKMDNRFVLAANIGS